MNTWSGRVFLYFHILVIHGNWWCSGPGCWAACGALRHPAAPCGEGVRPPIKELLDLSGGLQARGLQISMTRWFDHRGWVMMRMMMLMMMSWTSNTLELRGARRIQETPLSCQGTLGILTFLIKFIYLAIWAIQGYPRDLSHVDIPWNLQFAGRVLDLFFCCWAFFGILERKFVKNYYFGKYFIINQPKSMQINKNQCLYDIWYMIYIYIYIYT